MAKNGYSLHVKKQKLFRVLLIDHKRNIYNLAFGDWDAAKSRINDKAISNNSDREKILTTVAATAIVFTNRNLMR